MRLKSGLKVHHVRHEDFIVEADEKSIDLNFIYKLSPAAAYLWNTFCDIDFTQEMMHHALCEAYEVDSDQAQRDIEALLCQWEAYGLLIR